MSVAQLQQKVPPAELTRETFTQRNGASQRPLQLQNCTVYSLFQFYLHAFYKPNNITTKLSLKVKSYFQSQPNKETYIFHFRPTWRIKNEVRMEKLLQGVTPLLQNFDINLMPILFCYISQVIGQYKFDIFISKMWRKKQ